MALGLLVDDRFDLAMGIVEHCIFQIKHYNKVLNEPVICEFPAGVSDRADVQYLARSQPPFLTDLIVQIYGSKSLATRDRETLNPWLKRAISAAIRSTTATGWCSTSLDVDSGLSRYRPGGTGIPPRRKLRTSPTSFSRTPRSWASRSMTTSMATTTDDP